MMRSVAVDIVGVSIGLESCLRTEPLFGWRPSAAADVGLWAASSAAPESSGHSLSR
jgi:hypothetical protein